MKKITYFTGITILFISLFSNQVFSQSTGLLFYGQEHVANDRTSLALFSQKPCKTTNHFNIEFDFALEKNYQSYFGYILRILNSEGKNIDLILENNKNSNLLTLNLIVGENEPILSLPLSKDYLYQWKKVKIDFDIVNKTYSLNVGNFYTEEKGDFLPLNNSIKIFFGVNHEGNIETTDLPNMRIRDIVFSKNHKVANNWPLNNHEGNESYDVINKAKASIQNPYWLHQNHVEWKLTNNYFINDIAFITYNQKGNQFYIISPDSLYTYFPGSPNNNFKIKFSERLNLSKGQGLIYDTINDKLIWYSPDLKLISKYDIESQEWSRNMQIMRDLTVFWQHNKYISPLDSSLKIIGGYGMHEYKNLIQSFNLNTGEWIEFEPNHSNFSPRYLSGLGMNKTADTVYVLGGYGSIQGDQKLQPKYCFDLTRIIPSANKVEQVFTYDELNIDGFCFANSIIIQDDFFYALAFSKFEYNNYLQLYKGSLTSHYLEPYSEKIPFSFHDVMTFVDLHYSHKDGKLYTTISFLNDKKETDIKIYEINFPPEKKILPKPDKKNNYLNIIIGALVLLFIVPLFFIHKKNRKKGIAQLNKSDIDKEVDTNKPNKNNLGKSAKTKSKVQYRYSLESKNIDEDRKNQLLLFGGFQIINEGGVDITAKFTPLLKEMFLLIFLNSFGDRKGVSSEYLKEILWSDKTSKDARNNRAVNMSKLKSILAELGNSTISKETGYWKVNIDYSKVYVDYAYLYNLVHSSNLDQQQMIILTEITRNKPFLKNISNDWLDSFKAEVSNDTVDTLIKWAMDNVEKSDPSFIIPITDAVFEFDSINEEAVELKCRSLVKLGKHSLAKSTYDNFVKDYKILYDEDYSTSFNELIS